jgi:hypothetical protein
MCIHFSGSKTIPPFEFQLQMRDPEMAHIGIHTKKVIIMGCFLCSGLLKIK